jgi:hypothetical protein
MQSFFLVLLVLAAIVEVIVANGQYVAPTIWPQVRIIRLSIILLPCNDFCRFFSFL